MTVVLAAIVLGGAAGLVVGGRPANLAGVRIRSIWLLIVGAAAQGGVSVLTGAEGYALLVASYLLLAAFTIRNVAVAGMGVVLLGIALNLAPIVADAGMPVEGSAIVQARVARPEDVATLGFGGKRHLARAGDHLRFLDDSIPEWVTHEVLSAGDLVIGAGVAAVVAGLMRHRRPRRGPTTTGAAPTGPPAS